MPICWRAAAGSAVCDCTKRCDWRCGVGNVGHHLVGEDRDQHGDAQRKPTWRSVLSAPQPTPATLGGSEPMAAEETEGKTRPMPIPDEDDAPGHRQRRALRVELGEQQHAHAEEGGAGRRPAGAADAVGEPGRRGPEEKAEERAPA